jgi:rfaE bifunctional protein nucleotidyltransferase chain/domain/rfaE bifunctional protein kinase chain/domain
MTAATPCARQHVRELRDALQDFGPAADLASTWGARVAEVLSNGGRLLAAGNGGSAAQAQHLTAELVGRYRLERRPLSALCLNAETSSLTAIANDYSVADLFARQVEAHGRSGDIVALLSTSGNSPNVVAAAVRAREMGLHVLAFTGPRPNLLADAADEVLSVEARYTATVQELHLAALHILCAAVDEHLGLPSTHGIPVTDLAEGVLPRTTPSAVERTPPDETTVPRSAPLAGRGTRPLVIVGDALLDVDLTGEVSRVAPDAPVPVVTDVVEHPRPGGAALAALLAASDGVDVVLVTPLAEDAAAQRLLDLLNDVQVVALPCDGATGVKSRVRAGGQSLLRIDGGGTSSRVAAVPAAVAEVLEGAGAVLVSDYGRGTTSSPELRRLLSRLPSRIPVVWDPHPRGADPTPGVHLVTPNAGEARQAAARFGVTPSGKLTELAAVRKDAETLAANWKSTAVAVTLGSRGALLSYGAGAPVMTPATDVKGADPCGAGDRFAVAAATALLRGDVLTEAVQHAVLAASAYVAAGGPNSLHRAPERAPSVPRASVPEAGRRAAAAELAARTAGSGGVVVATGGCFDLLHAGHVATLRAARQLGDCLIVCLNSDDSVRRLKGGTRPLVPVEDRVRVLEALECVDAVVVFEEDTPQQLLQTLRPHVWAKGGDYAGAEVPEADVLEEWGGQAIVLPYLAGRSTTSLVEVAASDPVAQQRPIQESVPNRPRQIKESSA